MSIPAAKRRRVGAASALHKPFKSPFRTPLKPQSEAVLEADGADQSTSTSIEPHSTPTASAPQPKASYNPTTCNPTYTTPPRRGAIASSNALRPNSTNSALVALRAEIQTLTQATSLATSSTDADLEVLIDRWRTASRAAAEELFASTRDRVNRMGGVGAWREREREQRDRTAKWEREEREAEMIEARERMTAAREEAGLGGGRREFEARGYEEADGDGGDEQDEKAQDDGADDDSFTMDMMLKTLNIDLNVIGYDRIGQRWIG